MIEYYLDTNIIFVDSIFYMFICYIFTTSPSCAGSGIATFVDSEIRSVGEAVGPGAVTEGSPTGVK